MKNVITAQDRRALESQQHHANSLGIVFLNFI